MRASSFLSFDEGISTVSWAAMIPLRMRVRKSAMGSVMLIPIPLPAGLGHAGGVALVGHLAQADPAEAELVVDGRPHLRQRVYALVLYFAGRAERTIWEVLAMGEFSLGSSGRDGLVVQGLEAGRAPVTGEGHAQCVEQREGLGVGLRGGRDRHVQSAHLVDVVVVDLGEDDLLADAHRVVAAPVERARAQPAEVP